MDDVKYLKDGREVVVIEKITKGILVEKIYYDGEEGYCGGGLEVVSQVFDSPPTEKFHEKIAALESDIKQLLYMKKNLREQISNAEKTFESQEKERELKYRQHEQLERLDDYLAGNITHFVYLVSYGPKITTIEDERKEHEDRIGSMKLLTLFGNSQGDLNWKINAYKDGSGCYTEVFPCQSYEEAKEVLGRFINDTAKTYLENKRTLGQSTIDVAEMHGIQVEQAYLDEAKKARLKNIEKGIAESSEKIARLKKEALELNNDR